MRWLMFSLVWLAACATSSTAQRASDDDVAEEEADERAEAAPAPDADAEALTRRNQFLLNVDVPDPPKLVAVPSDDFDLSAMGSSPTSDSSDEPEERPAPQPDIRVSIVQLTPIGAKTEVALSGAKLTVGMKGSLAYGGKRAGFAISRVDGGTAYATVAVPVADLKGVKSATVKRGQ